MDYTPRGLLTAGYRYVGSRMEPGYVRPGEPLIEGYVDRDGRDGIAIHMPQALTGHRGRNHVVHYYKREVRR